MIWRLPHFCSLSLFHLQKVSFFISQPTVSIFHLSFLRKSNPEFSAPTGFISPRKLHIRRPASIYLLRFDCALHFHIRMPYMAGCLSSPTAYSPSLSHSVSSAWAFFHCVLMWHLIRFPIHTPLVVSVWQKCVKRKAKQKCDCLQ